LHFKRADVDTTIYDAVEPWPALIEERWWSEARIARIYGRAAKQ
jgi:hypothetical protein